MTAVTAMAAAAGNKKEKPNLTILSTGFSNYHWRPSAHAEEKAAE